MSGTHTNGIATKGLAVWLTGLSGAGKSTLCRAAELRLRGDGVRVCVLDAEELRQTVSRDLGFSRADRDENVMRLATLARVMVRQETVVLIAAISPYWTTRARARQQIGNFLEVYVEASLEECVRRDTKGHYARALRGELKHFTGIDDPYEPPVAPDLVVNTALESVDQCVARLLAAIEGARRLDVEVQALHAGAELT